MSGIGLQYSNVFNTQQPNANNSIFMANGTLNTEYNTMSTEDVNLIDKKPNSGGNNTLNSIFSNLGGWLTGASSVINAVKGNPVQPVGGGTLPPDEKPKNNMWIWLVVGVVVLGVGGFFLIKKN